MMDDWDPEAEDRWMRETWEAEHIFDIYVGKFKKAIQLGLVAIIVLVVEAFIIWFAVVSFDLAAAYKL